MKLFQVCMLLSSLCSTPILAINYPRIAEQKGIDMNIRKVVIPAAGYGTRFLPITKAIPKEMLPLLNKPALQNIVEECNASGLHNINFIIHKNKTEINVFFSSDFTFQSRVQKQGKGELISDLGKIISHSQFTYIKQREMLGLGHAIMMAQPYIEKEMFCVLLPDMVVFDTQPCMKPIVEAAQKHEATVIAVMEVPMAEISSYGCIKVGAQLDDNLMEISDLIEKPKQEEAFSNLAILGRYVFTPAIFDAIEATAPHASGEIQLTDAIALLARQGHKVLAYKVNGTIFDLGRPQGWLAANIFLGMQSNEIGDEVRKIVRQFI